MYLTRMALDMSKRRTMLALTSPSIFHGAVEQAFPGPRKRRLWRIDRLRGTTYLMILSEDRPDLTRAEAELGVNGAGWESRDYQPLLDRITKGSVWRFRLCANPTYSQSCPEGRGKVHAHRTPEHQMEWLMKQGDTHGFTADNSFGITESQWYRFRKGDGSKRDVSLLRVTYEGTLVVTDVDRFRSTLQEGIGREKAYGMGLMTVIGGEMR